MRRSPPPVRLLAAALACAALAPPPAAAHPPTLPGTPLLELHGQGLQRTLQTLPACRVPPCDFRDPRFASWHILVFADGRAAVSIADNSLDDAAGSGAEAVLGSGDPSLLALLRNALGASRIGFAAGNCRASADFPTPLANDKVDVLDFDWRLTWYGKGNRLAVLELPVSGVPYCDTKLDSVVHWAVNYAQSVRQAAANP